MLVDDWSLSVQREDLGDVEARSVSDRTPARAKGGKAYFEGRTESVEQNGKEEQRATRVERCCGRLQVVKLENTNGLSESIALRNAEGWGMTYDRADDQGHG